jgi:hypothetical protein
MQTIASITKEAERSGASPANATPLYLIEKMLSFFLP